MTSNALHNKYRPTTLDEVVGQDHIKDGLRAQLAAGTQQAFLFEGPSGTGKTTLARICASELGLTEVIEIDAATHTGVDARPPAIAAGGNASSTPNATPSCAPKAARSVAELRPQGSTRRRASHPIN